MSSKRRRFSGELKAKVVLEALRGDRTLQEIASQHQVHPNQVGAWKRQAVRKGEATSIGWLLPPALPAGGTLTSAITAPPNAHGRFHGLTEGLAMIDRDRGASHDAAPPTPPGIRVRTTAVRPN